MVRYLPLYRTGDSTPAPPVIAAWNMMGSFKDGVVCCLRDYRLCSKTLILCSVLVMLEDNTSVPFILTWHWSRSCQREFGDKTSLNWYTKTQTQLCTK